MKDEIICTDGSFAPEAMEFYQYYGVVTPKKDARYTIREVIMVTGNPDGEIGFLLNELQNPKVPVFNTILGRWSEIEPSWRYSRFAHLSGGAILIKEARQMLRERLKVKIIEPTLI